VDLIIAVADPNADDVRALLERHLTFARGESPPEHVHALHTEAWADPARALYRKAGFRPCPPFGPYTVNPYSVCMTLVLDSARQA
jgi:putative acetyltransferase